MEILSIILSVLALGVSGTVAYHLYKNRVTDDKVSALEKRQDFIESVINNYEMKPKKK